MTRKLSILTVVHKNPSGLLNLCKGLCPILSDDVEWIIKDSNQCLKTQEWGATLTSPNIRFISTPDSGIYEALNMAIASASADFYLTVGADDLIYPKGVESFVNNYSKLSKFDILTYPVIVNSKLCLRNQWIPAFVNLKGFVSSHSVGTVIRKSLHSTIGLYDVSYRILSDSYFLKLCVQREVKFLFINKPAMGEFGTDGISSKEKIAVIRETYKYQRESGSSWLLQYILYVLRVIRFHLSKR